MLVIPIIPNMFIRIAGYLVGPRISCCAYKLVRTPGLPKINKKDERKRTWKINAT
jgi:hypothetical protein